MGNMLSYSPSKILDSYRIKQKAKYIMGIEYSHSKSLLHHACRYGYVSVIRMLLSIDVNIEETAYLGRTPLHLACMSNCVESVILLLEAGANIEARDDSGKTPLHFACRYDNDKIVKILLEAGANIEARDDNGKTPLFYAYCCEQINVIKTLLDKNVDLIPLRQYFRFTRQYFIYNDVDYNYVKRTIRTHLLRKELNTNFEQHVPAVIDLCCDYIPYISS